MLTFLGCLSIASSSPDVRLMYVGFRERCKSSLKVGLFKNLPTFTDLYSTSSFVGLVIVRCGNWKLGLGKPYF